MDAYIRGELPQRQHVWGLDWQAEYSSFKTYDNAEFEVPLEEREEEEIPVEAFEDSSDRDIIQHIATEYGNKIVNGYYLVKGAKGLLLKQDTLNVRRGRKYGT
jgi:hypothetical protein